MENKKYIIFLLLLFLQKSIWAQDYSSEKFLVKNKSENSLGSFPFVFGVELGVPIKINKTYFNSTFSGFMGIGFNKEKTFRLTLRYGILTPNKELSADTYGLINLGFALRVLKINDSRVFTKIGYSIVTAKSGSFGGPSAGIIYEHKLANVFSISGGVEYPIIRDSRYNEYYHNPFISLGITFFSP